MDFESALGYAKKGDAILFTGAGFSWGARSSLKPFNVPTAEQFASELAAAVGVEGKYQLPAIAEYFVKKKGEHDLVRVLLETFSIASVAKHHIDLAQIPWRRVYTTNYDNCFELAASSSNIEWTPLTTDAIPQPTSRRCVHINGHISHLTIETLRKQVKLTHSSYSSENFANNQWSQQLRQDITASRAVFFVGYSMADLDISRIIYQLPELSDRTFFITSPTNDPVSASLLEPYGTVLPIGVEAFAASIVSAPTPQEAESYSYSWLTKYEPSGKPKKPLDVSTHDLILRGIVSDDMFAWAMAEPQSGYVIRRESVDDIIREIEKGRKWSIVHADLGNGKSILKEQISYVLTRGGYNVFWDSEFSLNKREDLKHLSRSRSKSVIMLDADPDRFNTIDMLRSFDFDNLSVIIFLRTTLFQLGERRYEDELPEDFAEHDVNSLTDTEITKFVNALDGAGLWGELSNLTELEKSHKIKVDFERSIQKIILSIFEHSEVGKKVISEAASFFANKDTISRVLLLTFILPKLEISPNPTMISDLLGDVDVWRLGRSPDFKKAGEFVRFENGRIRTRSSVLANVLLRSAVQPEFLLETIERIVRGLATARRSGPMHHVFTQLSRFPVIEGMIDKHPRKRELIIGYFQALSDLPTMNGNADYWLHYAMARLSYGDFDVAARFFATARKLAEGNIKKTVDVNNHFARLLLDSRIKTDDYEDYYKAFEMAHSILISQMNRENNRHYPYRQAKKYVEFISFRRSRLSQDEVRRFIVACRQVKAAIENLTGRLTYASEIAECARQMDRAIELALGEG